MPRLLRTVGGWLKARLGGVASKRCPGCSEPLQAGSPFCGHCYMVLRPEGMAALHESLQGGRIPQDIYILRNLHPGDKDSLIVPAEGGVERPGPLPGTEGAAQLPKQAAGPRGSSEEVAPSPEPEGRQAPVASAPASRGQPANFLNYTFASPPPTYAGPASLDGLLEWFLQHDPLTPNNLPVLEEAHRVVSGPTPALTYRQSLRLTLREDLEVFDDTTLLAEHLRLLTTTYARALQRLRTLNQERPGGGQPHTLPSAQERTFWSLCHILGTVATRLRLEGWVIRSCYGEPAQPARLKPRAAKRRRRAAGG